MIIVLDTNVLLKALPRTSIYRPIFEAIRSGKIQLAFTTEILLEYVEILGQRTTPEISRNVANLLVKLPHSLMAEVYVKWSLIADDPDDNKFVDCAVAANAAHLVTDDKHFQVLRNIEFPPLNVLSSDELLALLDS